MAKRYLYPLSTLLRGAFPSDWIAPTFDALDSVLVDPAESHLEWTSDILVSRHRLYITTPPEFNLPLLPGSTVRLAPPRGAQSVQLLFTSEPTPLVRVEDIRVTLHMPPEILQAFRRPSEGAPLERDRTVDGYDIVWTTSFQADIDGHIDFERDPPAFPPAAIASSGFILEIQGARILMGSIPENLRGHVPYGFKGVWLDRATLGYLDRAESGTTLPALGIESGTLGPGGFSGTLFVEASDLSDATFETAFEEAEARSAATSVEELDEIAAGLYLIQLEGMSALLHRIGLTFDQSVPSGGQIAGHAYLPLAERWVAFTATINGPDGDFALEIGGAGKDALVSLDVPWLDIEVESIEYVTEDGVHWAVIDGSVRPKIPGFDWPRVRVEGLRISSEGDVDLPGGWLVLPESATIDFHGFDLELSKLGLGTEERDGNRRRWFGFSGGITLAKGLPVSGSVEGLKFSWPVGGAEEWEDGGGSNVDVSLRGIGVDLEIPGLLHLQGDVAYVPVEGDDEDTLTGHIFKGRVDVDIPPLKTAVGAELMIGKVQREDTGQRVTVVFLALEADLPTPIPLGGSGAGIYRLSGLFGMHAAPDRDESLPWYEWYKRPMDGDAAYELATVKKWHPAFDEHAFGVGLMVGTQFDDGRTLNVNAMAVVLVPGPVVMIEGTANVLKKMADDRKQEGAFHALAVIDGRAGTFQLNVDARYDLQKIVRITGSLEAFFNFNDFTDWHFYLGQKTPESKRIQAKILSIFTAQTYFMIQFEGLQTGAKAGYELRKKLGPAKVELVAVLSYDARIWWKPVQLGGRLEIRGKLGIEVFGIGLSLLLQLLLEAKAPDPYWIHGLALIKLKLPWPLPNPKIKVEFTWGGEGAPDPAPFLKDGSMVHHKADDASWGLLPLEGDAMPEPSTFDISTLSEWVEHDPEAADPRVPVIPLDARPVLNFGRPVHNLMAVDPDLVEEWRFTYELTRLQLWVRDGDASWSRMMEYPMIDIFHSFDLEVGPSNSEEEGYPQEPFLELWRFSPLDTAGPRWLEGHPARSDACAGPPSAPTLCVDWEDVEDGTVYPWEFEHEELFFAAAPGRLGFDGPTAEFRPGRGPSTPVRKVLVSTTPLEIRLPEPVSWLEITFLLPPLDPATTSYTPWVDAYHGGHFVATLPRTGDPAPHLRTYGWSASDPGDGKLIDTLRIYAGSIDISDPGGGSGRVADGSQPDEDMTSEDFTSPGGGIVDGGGTTEPGGDTVIEPERDDDVVSEDEEAGGDGVVSGPDLPLDLPLSVDLLDVIDLPLELDLTDDGTTAPPDDEVDPGLPGGLERDLALLVEICYRTAREERREQINETPAGAGPETDGERPLLPLEPDRTYQVVATTTITVRREGSASASTIEDAQTYLFHTGVGPRQIVGGGGPSDGTGYESFSEAADAPVSMPDFASTRLNRLGSYVARTNPTSDRAPFYPAYDLSIEFSEPYVESMYRDSEELRIRVRDRNGQALGETTGAWNEGLLPLLPAGLLSLLAHQAEQGCVDDRSEPASPTPVLGRSSPTTELESNRRYTAEVVLTSDDGDRGPLFDFPFRTSRFTDFRAHLESGPTDAEGRQRLRPLRTVASTAPDGFEWDDSGAAESWVDEYNDQRSRLDGARAAIAGFPAEIRWRELPALKEHLETAHSAWTRLDDVATRRFDDLCAALGLSSGHRPLPPTLEIGVVGTEARPGTVLLIESPEPIEWARTAFALQRVDVDTISPVDTHLLWSQDRTRAFVIAQGVGWIPPGDYRLDLTYQGGLGDLPPVTETGPGGSDPTYVETRVELKVQIGDSGG